MPCWDHSQNQALTTVLDFSFIPRGVISTCFATLSVGHPQARSPPPDRTVPALLVRSGGKMTIDRTKTHIMVRSVYTQCGKGWRPKKVKRASLTVEKYYICLSWETAPYIIIGTMKTLYHLVFIVLGVFLLTSCKFGHTFDFSFHENRDLIIPANEGTYYFEVEATIETKTSFDEGLLSFEYRIRIDGAIFDKQIVNIRTPNRHIHKGDVFQVSFVVPANESTEHRTVTVDLLKAKEGRGYRDNLDPGNNSWQLVWEATQLGR